MNLNYQTSQDSSESYLNKHNSKVKEVFVGTTEHSLQELPNLEETQVFSSWLKSLYKKQFEKQKSEAVGTAKTSLTSSLNKVDLLVERLTLIGKLNRSEWLIGSQLASKIYAKIKPGKRAKYASIFAITLYIAHKFVVDHHIWYPKEFGQIVGIPTRELISLTQKYLIILDYRIPLAVDPNSNFLKNINTEKPFPQHMTRRC